MQFACVVYVDLYLSNSLSSESSNCGVDVSIACAFHIRAKGQELRSFPRGHFTGLSPCIVQKRQLVQSSVFLDMESN